MDRQSKSAISVQAIVFALTLNGLVSSHSSSDQSQTTVKTDAQTSSVTETGVSNQSVTQTQSDVTPSQDQASSNQTVDSSKSSKEEKKELKAAREERKQKDKLLGGKAKNQSDDSTTDKHAAPCISWVDPVVKPKICLLCIHGLGLYSGSYTSFGKWMAKRGVATYAIDVRGFGSWMKLAGDTEIDFPACLNDIKIALTSIKAANPGLPIYLLGESMGGSIALKSAALYPELIDGLVSSVPAGERFKQKKTDLKVALEFLTGPNKQHDMGKAVVAQATENGKLRQDWEDNPMDRMNFSAKQLMQFQKFMNENHDAAKLIQEDPVLVLQGSEDKLVKPEGTWEIFNELAVQDKMMFVVPSEHLIFEEQQDHPQKFDEKVSRAVLTWFQTHLPGKYKWNEMLTLEDHTNTLVKIFNNDLIGAKKELDQSIATDPSDAKSYFLRGLVETKLNQPLKAKLDFAKAIGFGRGNDSSRQANGYLTQLAQNKGAAAAPGAAEQSKMVLDPATLKSLGIAGQPAILAFYAPWAEQCKDIDKISAQGTASLHNVKICKIDIDDSQYSSLITACSIGPIPTFVFVTPKGTVGSMSIGLNNFANFAKNIKVTPAVTAQPAH